MKTIRFLAVPAGLAALLISAAAEDPVTAVVKGDRVNLRARPALDAEVVGQAGGGETLTVRAKEGEWMEIVPPERVDVWVHRDFVRDGVVQTASLQVRSGPGINYHRIGALKKGDAVKVRGEFGEWLKIAPPPEVSLWVHRDYVQWPPPKTPPPEPKAVAQPSVPPPAPAPPRPLPRPPAAADSRPVAPRPPQPPPPDLKLTDAPNQGRVVQREGVVKPVGYLFGRPSRFQLVVERVHRPETLCYLYGNDEQLAGFQNRRLAVEGREYWIQGVRQPMLVIERIRLLDR